MKTTAPLLVSFLVLAACGSPAEPPGTVCDESGVICTWMGTGTAGKGGDGLRPWEATVYFPMDVDFDLDGTPYVADWNNHRVRTVIDEMVVTLVGTGVEGAVTLGPGTETMLDNPTSVAVAPDGTVAISAWHNSRVVRYDPATGEVTTICGDGSRDYIGEDGPAVDATTDLPAAVAYDPLGRLILVDQANQRLRRIEHDGLIHCIAGTGEPGYSGDGGPAIEAQIHAPVGQTAYPAGGLTVDSDGVIFHADSGNHLIRRIDPEGMISTVAGNGEGGYGGDGGSALDGKLNRPCDVAVDKAGNLFIADTDNHCVRVVDTSGTIHTYVGECGQRGGSGDGGQAVDARLDRPYGVTTDPWGRLFVTDTYNHRIRVISP